MRNKKVKRIRTEDDTDQGENDQLGDDEEPIITRDDGSIQTRVSCCTLVLREPPENVRQKVSKQSRDSGR